jgi:hypothetical protein
MTIFNLTARQDLQRAFDQISHLISPPMAAASGAGQSGEESEQKSRVIVIRGAMRNRDDLGMSVALVRGDDGIAKCFCVTLVRNPSSPFDDGRPVPVSFDAITAQTAGAKNAGGKGGGSETNPTPAFTSG